MSRLALLGLLLPHGPSKTRAKHISKLKERGDMIIFGDIFLIYFFEETCYLINLSLNFHP
jgi:hypothetical protein